MKSIALLLSCPVIFLVTIGLFIPDAATAQVDPFEWLEAPRAPNALEWARLQTDKATSHLRAEPKHNEIEAGLRKLLQFNPPPPAFVLLGNKVLRLIRDREHPHGLLQVARRDRGVPFAWRTILDVGTLRTSDGRPYELQLGENREPCLPPEYMRCLLRLSPGGGDAAELREIDLRDGNFPADGFRVNAGRLQFSWMSASRILIATDAVAGRKTQAGWPADVRLWQRGTSLPAAPIVYRASADDAILTISALGSGRLRKGVINRVIDYSTFELKIVDQIGKVTSAALPKRIKPFGYIAFTERHIIVQLAHRERIGRLSFPAETVLAYDTAFATKNDRRVAAIFTPQSDEFVNDLNGGVVGTATSIHLIVDSNLTKHAVTLTFGGEGWTAKVQDAVPAGQGLTFAASDPRGEDVLLNRTGFLTPTSITLQRSGEPEARLYSEREVLRSESLMVEIGTASSADGTPIDFYLIRPKNPVGFTPTLMTGYGAFGTTITPGYLDYWVGGVAAALWFERGGAMVIPAIRGGGERGEAWHLAALGNKRERSYEDFIAVAERLIKNGFTDASRLGVFGSSNGGLLAATVAIKRPDLFRAVVSDAPLIDMLRFPMMGIGAAWKLEYGDPSDPSARVAIKRYSPYHNIRDGLSYPAFFISVSTGDNRVGPGHARKLAARLSEAGATTYFYENGEGGHGVSDALQRPDLMALRTTFLVSTLMSAPTSVAR